MSDTCTEKKNHIVTYIGDIGKKLTQPLELKTKKNNLTT